MYVEDKRHFGTDTIDLWRAMTEPFAAPPAGCPGSYFAPYKLAMDLYGQSVRVLFPEEITQVTIVGLLPSAQIVGHKDAPIVGRRIHIPLQTNPGCWSFSGRTWQRLQLESGYWMDPTEVHGAVNWGETVRLHLVVDVG